MSLDEPRIVGSEDVVGREHEQAELVDFLRRIPDAPFAVSLVGEPGIGKTKLWSKLLDEAHSLSLRTLTCRPIESDTPLSFAALGDLLAGVEEEAVSSLPAPQRRSMEIALLLEETTGPPIDRRAVALATLGSFRVLARSEPLLVAVDDLQWMDQESARVLEFVARRLTTEPIGFLCSRRAGGRTAIDLAAAFPEGRHEEMRLGPLSVGAFMRLIRMRVDPSLTRSILVRLHESSGGNPMFGLEMARALEGRVIDPGQPFPVPANLQTLVRGRLSKLSGTTRDALTMLAASIQRDLPMLEKIVSQETVAEEVLREGLDGGVLELNDDWIRFSHPLFASTLLADVGGSRRRKLHRRLADIVDEPESRVRHLALVTESPDEQVAKELFDAAERARGKGAVDAAAELAELSARMTPAQRIMEQSERLINAGDYAFEAGSIAEARTNLDEAVTIVPPGAVRARALQHMGWVVARGESWSKALGYYHSALAESHDDLALHSQIAVDSAFAHMNASDIPGGAADARMGLDLAERHGDPEAIAEALAMLAWFGFLMGQGIDRNAFERAVALERWEQAARYFEKRASAVYAFTLSFAGELDEARDRFHEIQEKIRWQGDEGGMHVVLFQLAMLETSAGNLRLADEFTREAVLAAEELEEQSITAFVLLARARVDTYLGRVESARAAAQEGLRLSAATDSLPGTIQHLHNLGVLELSLGNHLGAHENLANVADMLLAMGMAEPMVVPWVPDEVEALIGLGELDKAERLIEMLEERGRELQRPWALTMGARCRGHLCAARKDKDGALEAFEQAVRLHEDLQLPVERARTWLLKGQAERRFKQWGAARTSLEEGLAIFDRVGTPLWAERARSELKRVGGRGPASPQLTPSEQRIASLVAEGQTNKQVADALFLSVNTVESNLKRIFHKMGVSSRTELARKLISSTGNTRNS